MVDFKLPGGHHQHTARLSTLRDASTSEGLRDTQVHNMRHDTYTHKEKADRKELDNFMVPLATLMNEGNQI